MAMDLAIDASAPLSINGADLPSPTRVIAPGMLPNVTLAFGVPTYSHAAVGSISSSHGQSLSHTTDSHSMSSSSLSGMPVSGIRGNRTVQAHSIVICGPAGIGKSTLIQMHQANWRRRGLWGHAKVVKGEASPFTGLVSRRLNLPVLVLIAGFDYREFIAHVLIIHSPPTDDVPVGQIYVRLSSACTLGTSAAKRISTLPRCP